MLMTHHDMASLSDDMEWFNTVDTRAVDRRLLQDCIVLPQATIDDTKISFVPSATNSVWFYHNQAPEVLEGLVLDLEVS
ncbi:hypothetical protein RRG08_016177 [Elysia crispata]|uniref:Uncharacterized protein n=1 Tax=Elysia crispata TaxID=231223 RepID=A0AAE0ZPT4_9GAST|nr:hypothetical protein RRG08_016177 [Elysia crispata]